MSNRAVPAWLVAAAIAAYPTWEWWADRLAPTKLSSCMGFPTTAWSPQVALLSALRGALLTPLRGDPHTLREAAVSGAVPALVVLAGLLVRLGGGPEAAVGRRVAGALALAAVTGPLTWPYFDSRACGEVPVLSGPWWDEVFHPWSRDETCFLLAALVVLLATQRSPQRSPAALAAAPPLGPDPREAAARPPCRPS